MSPENRLNRNLPFEKEGYQYNDRRRPAPRHAFPATPKLDLHEFPGPAARILLEKALSSFEGMQLSEVERLGISARDLVKFRPQLRDAILAVIKEPPAANYATLRNGAIAYVGALDVKEAFDVVAGLATSPTESTEARSLAVDALRRVDHEGARATIHQMLADPHPVARKIAVRALRLIGNEADLAILKQQLEMDEDPEVRRQINLALQGGSTEQGRKKTRRQKKSQLILESIVRSLGRHLGSPPQTDYIPCPEGEVKIDIAGGRDLVAEDQQAQIQPVRKFPSTTYEVSRLARDGEQRLHLAGELAQADLCGASAYRLAEMEIAFDLPFERLTPGRPLPVEFKGCEPGLLPVWVPDAPASPILLEVSPASDPVWKGKEFAIRVRFRLPHNQPAPLLRLDVQMPMGGVHTSTFVVSEAEQLAGEKIVGGFTSVRTGMISVCATLFGGNGGAVRMEAQFAALPTNPISMQIYPQTTGTNGEGPAHYNSGEDRFYCYVRAEVANGFPFSVTVGPNVTCNVTDGGSPVANFSFTIGTTSIPANSVRNIYMWTRHGSSSNVYDVFEGFGDVRMDFTIQTSQGNISDWNVWAAMAQIRLALNFVGNISATNRANFQSILETEASNILEQQSLYISQTSRFLIPSSDSDFNRYRDIILDDNKAHDCTSGSDEADDMRDDWSSPTSWLDVWIVESFSGPACAANVLGFSPVDGPTNKDGDRSGFVIKIAGNNLTSTSGRAMLGLTVAHELGHFLGLEHDTGSTNFMNAFNSTTNTVVTHAQYRNMADHGFVERFVP